VTELDRQGFGIASGSACTASTLTPSHVLAAMGVLTHGNVRLGLPWPSEARPLATVEPEVDRFLDVLPGVLAELRGRVGL
jgi:cysteine desulfurase